MAAAEKLDKKRLTELMFCNIIKKKVSSRFWFDSRYRPSIKSTFGIYSLWCII